MIFEVILFRYFYLVIKYLEIFFDLMEFEIMRCILFIKISIGKNIGIIFMINYMYRCIIICIISI